MKRLLSFALIFIGFIGLFSSCDKDDDLAYTPSRIITYVTIPSDTTVNAEAHQFMIDVKLPGGIGKRPLELWNLGQPAFYYASAPEGIDPWFVADINPLGGWIKYGKALWAQEIAYKRGAYIWVSIEPNKTGNIRAIRLPLDYKETECWYTGQCIIWQLPEEE